jgi:hypothetical protein
MASLDTRIDLPMFGDTIAIPEFFIERYHHSYELDKNGLYKRDKKGKLMYNYARDKNGEILTHTNEKGQKGRILSSTFSYKLSYEGKHSINKTRQISSRKGQQFLGLAVGNVDKVEDIRLVKAKRPPTLRDFPRQSDRDLLINMINHKRETIDDLDPYDYPHNKTRGRPPILKKNWDYHGLGKLPEAYEKHKAKGKSKEKEDDKPFDWNDYPDTPESESPKENAGAGGGSGYGNSSPASSPSPPPKKGRGRPVKHQTEEDKYKAKLQSNKDKRAEKRIEERKKKIAEKLEKGEKLSKKERELHEGEMEGEGVDFEDIKWGTFTELYKRFLDKHPQFKDKIEDLEHFADFVLENKDKFSKKAEKKALFYNNIISNK